MMILLLLDYLKWRPPFYCQITELTLLPILTIRICAYATTAIYYRC